MRMYWLIACSGAMERASSPVNAAAANVSRSVIKQPWPFSQQLADLLQLLPSFLARLAVLEDRAAILVNLPDRRFGVGTLHGSVELGLLFRQPIAKDDVRHGGIVARASSATKPLPKEIRAEVSSQGTAFHGYCVAGNLPEMPYPLTELVKAYAAGGSCGLSMSGS